MSEYSTVAVIVGSLAHLVHLYKSLPNDTACLFVAPQMPQAAPLGD